MLGFGKSPHSKNIVYSLEHHVGAVIETLEVANVRRYTIVGYSLSCSLALHLSATHPAAITSTLLICPTLYGSFARADSRIYKTGDMPRWLLDGKLSQFACRFVCQNPILATPIYRIMARNVPLRIRDDARRHSWQSYRQTLDNIGINYRPQADFANLTTPLKIVIGDADASTDHSFLNLMSNSNSLISIETVTAGKHQLPHQYPQIITKQIIDLARNSKCYTVPNEK